MRATFSFAVLEISKFQNFTHVTKLLSGQPSHAAHGNYQGHIFPVAKNIGVVCESFSESQLKKIDSRFVYILA